MNELNNSNAVAKLITSAFLLTALIMGLAVAVVPIGVVARLAIVAMVTVSFAMAWAARSKNNLYMKRLMFSGVVALIVLSVIWPRYIFFQANGLPSVNVLTIFTMAVVYILSISLIYSPELSKKLGVAIHDSGWTGYVIFTWLVWRLISCIFGEEPIYSIAGYLRELIYITSFLFIGYAFFALNKSADWFAKTIILCGVFVGCIGVVEAYTEHNIFSQFATNSDDGENSNALASIALDKVREGIYRAQSTFEHPIVFSQFVAALTPITIYVLFKEQRMFWKMVAAFALIVALLSVIKSGSRAGIVSVIVAFAILSTVLWMRAVVYGKFTKIIAIISLPALVVAVAIGYYVMQDLFVGRGQTEMSSTNTRLTMFSHGIAALSNSPIFGFGHGMAIFKAGIVNSAGLATIDSYILSIALDSGYVGLLLMLLFISIFTCKSLVFSIKNPSKEGFFVGACLASVLAILSSFIGLSIVSNMTLLWLLMAACFSVINGQRI